MIIGRNARRQLVGALGRPLPQLRAVPELVFLNCCHLGRLDQRGPATGASGASTSSPPASPKRSWGSACAAWWSAGWAVDDNAASTFARHFYDRLLDGETFGDAVHEARNEVWREHRDDHDLGRLPVLWRSVLSPAHLGAAREKPRVFVSARELLEKVAEVTVAAASAGTTEQYLAKQSDRLRQLERDLEQHEEWRSGYLLHEMAKAWSAIGEYQRAIASYRAALLAKDGTAPLKAAEQLCNLLDRMESLGVPLEDVSAAPRSPLETDTATPSSAALRWLWWVEELGRPWSAPALRGGILKRAGQRAAGKERERLLKAAAEAYERAVELGREERGRLHYYPGLNLAAVRWALGAPKGKRQGRQVIKDLVAPSRDSALAEIERAARSGTRSPGSKPTSRRRSCSTTWAKRARPGSGSGTRS